ncbi:MAG: C25 family cysteine peptidase [Cyanobacteriota bacterium]|nr:C25 family cysteine peptidase [Cyanobacteriota bacterium]
MRVFQSLNPAGLVDSFDVAIYGEEPIVDIEESKGNISISYTFPGFYISDDEQDVEGERVSFGQINIAKTGLLSESGKPSLPSFGRYVQIPFNCDFDVIVKKGTATEFDSILVAPAQEQLTDSPTEENEFEYEQQFYAQDKLYPENLVEVTGPFEIDGYNTLLLHTRPLQYNPAQRKLIGYSNITVEINVTPKTVEAKQPASYDPDFNREAYGNFFVNPKRKIENRLEIDPSTIVVAPRLQRGPEFLIIYHDTFKQAAQRLSNWKRMRGIRTKIVSIADIGNTVDQIKTYIRKMRSPLPRPYPPTPSRLRYVLLFGDVDMIVPETVTDSPWGANVTDYYYSTPKNPENASDIVMPWLSIGRIPVRTADEGLAVVDQIIHYEKQPPCDPEYYRRMTFAAYFQDDRPQDGKANREYMKTMEEIREHLVTLGFDIERVYVSNNPNPQQYRDGTPVPTEVKNAIVNGTLATDMLISTTAEGQLLIGHRDHGGENGWSHPSFSRNHLGAVTSEQPTIFYSINCLTGKFDRTAPTESFAEMALRMKGGAPSLIAATRVSGTFRNDSLQKAMFDAMWPGVLPAFPGSTVSYGVRNNRLGDILNYAKSYLPIAHSGDSGGIKDHFEIYHVIGDPTLELWNTIPNTVSLFAKVAGNDLCIGLSACPKDGVLTIWNRDKLLKRLEPSSNYMKFSLKDLRLERSSTVRRYVLVCFKAPGYRFLQVVVSI